MNKSAPTTIFLAVNQLCGA